MTVVSTFRLGTHYPEVQIRYAKLEAGLRESSVPGRAWDGLAFESEWRRRV